MAKSYYREDPTQSYEPIVMTVAPFGGLRYDTDQNLTDAEKAKARKNADAASNTVVEPLINIWDEQCKDGTSINLNTGAEYSSANESCTSFIEVTPLSKFYLHSNFSVNFYARFYGQNKEYLRNGGSHAINYEHTVPNDVYFIRFVVSSATMPSGISINYPSTYTGYYPSGLPRAKAHIGGLGNAIGMRGWNQLISPSFVNKPTETTGGITFTNNGNGSITINGTATERAIHYIHAGNTASFNYIGGHHYLVLCRALSNTQFGINLGGWVGRSDTEGTIIIPSSSGSTISWWYSVDSGSVSNLTIYPQLIDLTALFGSGNEPATVAEFRSMFPSDYYPYCQGGFGDLLWTNASPTSAFPDNTSSPIQLKLSNYNNIIIIFRIYATAFRLINVIAGGEPSGFGYTACAFRGDGGSVFRNFVKTSSTVIFNGGKICSTYGNVTEDNNYMIPYQIYGIR